MKQIIPKCLLAFLFFSVQTGHCRAVSPMKSLRSDALIDSLSRKQLPALHPMSKYSRMIKGDFVGDSKLNPSDLIKSSLSTTQFGSLTTSGAKVKMVAFGGGLTAGMSNGGLYRQSQLFAYPNLVALQLGISDFQSPLFSEAEANGTGYMIMEDPGAKFPAWKKVSNNLAIVKPGTPPAFSSYHGRVDNWAFPKAGARSAMYTHKIDERNYPLWFEHQPYLWRCMPKEQNEVISLADFVKKNQDYDLVLIEDYFDEWIAKLLKTARINLYDFYQSQLVTGRIETAAFSKLIEGNKKAVLFTIPRYQDLAFFNWYSATSDIENVKAFLESYKSEAIQDQTKPKYFVPSQEVDNLFKGKEARITDLDVITELEEKLSDPEFASGHNSQIREFASKNHLALVDLAKIYSDIHKGTYTTDDGLKIDGSMKGNFFSSDGIYPTAIGQVVIANEVIKALNEAYSSQISLIKISDLSKSINVK